MKNIVLIGMPGCGKTTVGRILARITNWKLVDTDEAIVQKIRMPIAEYFKEFSHEEFRVVETQVIEELSKRSNQIIATGGGAVLNPVNVQNLKQNGTLYFLNRSLKTLIHNCHCDDGKNTGVRPLIKTAQDVENLYNQRFQIYKNACDIEIADNQSAQFIAEQIDSIHHGEQA